MPLFDLETHREVTKIPYERDYRTCVARMTDVELAAIEAWIDARIDGDTIHTAGWMPGANWIGTVLEPIYTKAARRDFNLSGRLFGLLVYARFMRRPEVWISGRFEMNGRDIGSRTYFRKP
jgi:hypothetical protein